MDHGVTEAEQNRLILENMDLVSKVASEFRGGKIEFEELQSIGREGLVKAARSFDPLKGAKFSTWARTKIESVISTQIRSQPSEWYPKDTDDSLSPMTSDKFERIYEHDVWGDGGNAIAISETWARLNNSPEDLALLFEDISDKRSKFEAAFISLSVAQRKLVRWVYLTHPAMSIEGASRELHISRFAADRLLKKALKTMREVIIRMEDNEMAFESNTANVRRQRKRDIHGCALETVAA